MTARQKREEEKRLSAFALASIAHYCFVETKTNCGIGLKNGIAQVCCRVLAERLMSEEDPSRKAVSNFLTIYKARHQFAMLVLKNVTKKCP